MKAVICLLAIVAGANAGFLGLGLGLGGPFAPIAPAPVSRGWSSGPGVVPVSKIVKIIQSPVQVVQPAPVQIVQPAPVQIVKVISEAQPGWSQPILGPAPEYKIIKIIQKPAIGW